MSFIFLDDRQVRCYGAYDVLWCVWRFGDSSVKNQNGPKSKNFEILCWRQ